MNQTVLFIVLATVSAGLIEDGIADEIVCKRRQELIRRNRIVSDALNGFVTDSEAASPMRYIRLPDYFTGKSFEICAELAEGVTHIKNLLQ